MIERGGQALPFLQRPQRAESRERGGGDIRICVAGISLQCGDQCCGRTVEMAGGVFGGDANAYVRVVQRALDRHGVIEARGCANRVLTNPPERIVAGGVPDRSQRSRMRGRRSASVAREFRERPFTISDVACM